MLITLVNAGCFGRHFEKKWLMARSRPNYYGNYYSLETLSCRFIRALSTFLCNFLKLTFFNYITFSVMKCMYCIIFSFLNSIVPNIFIFILFQTFRWLRILWWRRQELVQGESRNRIHMENRLAYSFRYKVSRLPSLLLKILQIHVNFV